MNSPLPFTTSLPNLKTGKPLYQSPDYEQYFSQNSKNWEFPGGPVVRTPRCLTAEGLGLIPGQGAKIPQAMWPTKPPKTKNKNLK